MIGNDMKYLSALIAMLAISGTAEASSLVFEFVNPAFARTAESGEYLLKVAEANRSGGRIVNNHSYTKTYSITINNGALTLQNGNDNSSSVTIQSGSGNSATTIQN